MYVWFEWSKKRVLYFVFSNTLEIFLKKPQKNHRPTVVCFVPMVYSKVLAEVSAESKYSIGCLVIWLFVFLFILYLENEE